MSAQFEAFLAKLYVDRQARERFLADPQCEASKAGLAEDDCAALDRIDFIGLELAAESFARKRASHSRKKTAAKLTRWLKRR